MEKELNDLIIPSVIITTCINALFFYAKEFFSSIGKYMLTDGELLTLKLKITSNDSNPDSQKIVIDDKYHCVKFMVGQLNY